MARRLGLVGAGSIGQTYIEAAHADPNVRLVGIADQRSDAAVAAAESAGCPAFHHVQDLIEDASPEGLIICTPPVSHFEIAKTALGAGIAVLCEKPLCLRIEDARNLRTLAAENGVLFTMASKFRYVDDVIQAKAILSSDSLGELILAENTFTARVQMGNRWNTDPSISGGGVIIDNGTHSVDILRYLLGPIDEVLAVEGKRLQSGDVEDSALLVLCTEAGIDARIELSWSYHKPDEHYVSLYGTRGTLSVGWARSRYKRHQDKSFTEFGSGYNKLSAIGSQIRNFCAAIHGDEPMLICSDDAVASVEVIDAAYASLHSGRRVNVRVNSAQVMDRAGGQGESG
ncbi:MAG: Gfo/Idh/MocA family oxidoreductase [Hyphomicrobiales bacterium]|nr:Gfo/Idh/MocA family oxidoreductase [Hyphomicrobiales bacterium]